MFDDEWDPWAAGDLPAEQMFGGQIPGKTPANQQSFIAAMGKLLGQSPITGGGGVRPQFFEEQYVPEEQPILINPYRETYAGSPLYDTLFNAVENTGAAPDRETVSKAYAALGKATPSDEEITDVLGVLKGFAMSNLENEKASMEWSQRDATGEQRHLQEQDNAYGKFQAENADELQNFTFRDNRGEEYAGSASIQGGPGYDGTASEYDLLSGADIEGNLDAIIGAYADTQRSGARAQQAGAVGADARRQATQLGRTSPGAGGPRPAVTRPRPTAVARSVPQSDAGRFSRNTVTDQYAEQMARVVMGNRLDRARNTRVRSDANVQNRLNLEKYARLMARPNDD